MTRRNFLTEEIKEELVLRFSLTNKGLVVRGNHKKLFDEFRNAHWYYLDFYCHQPGSTQAGVDGSIPIAFQDFCEEMLRFIPEWKQLHIKWRQLYESWRQQTSKTVRCGAIILDDTFSYVLLVKGFFRDGYQFPAGKKDHDGEPYETCAIRELAEETGFDISNLISPSLFFERKVFNCLRRYYLITGVNPNTLILRPSSRNEIKMILWMKVDDLPEDNDSARMLGYSPRDFFLCLPWAKQIKAFSRHLRDGRLLFQALELCELSTDDTDDNNEERLDISHKVRTAGRHSKNLRKSDENVECRSRRDYESDVGDHGIKTQFHMPLHNLSQNNGLSFEKGKTKRRYDRRKHRINSVSSNEFTSHSYTDDETVFTRVTYKDSVRKRSHGKVKDGSISKVPSSFSSSDSGYSDQSDPTPARIDDESVSFNDSLMTQALLALKQISIK